MTESGTLRLMTGLSAEGDTSAFPVQAPWNHSISTVYLLTAFDSKSINWTWWSVKAAWRSLFLLAQLSQRLWMPFAALAELGSCVEGTLMAQLAPSTAALTGFCTPNLFMWNKRHWVWAAFREVTVQGDTALAEVSYHCAGSQKRLSSSWTWLLIYHTWQNALVPSKHAGIPRYAQNLVDGSRGNSLSM